MTYKVVITEFAKCQLESYIEYTLREFQSARAARAIRDDAKMTKNRLSTIAGSLPLCQNEILAAYGYRRIRFDKHGFFMVYRINDSVVVVEGMYHELQDYESAFTQHIDR